MEIWLVLFILFAHWYADFVGQTNEMAMNKSTDIGWLTYHVSVYTLLMMFFTVLIFVILFFGNIISSLPLVLILIPIAVSIFITHWITDFITSKITSKLWKGGKVHKFFIVIGFDQWLHAVQLLIIYKVFLL